MHPSLHQGDSSCSATSDLPLPAAKFHPTAYALQHSFQSPFLISCSHLLPFPPLPLPAAKFLPTACTLQHSFQSPFLVSCSHPLPFPPLPSSAANSTPQHTRSNTPSALLSSSPVPLTLNHSLLCQNLPSSPAVLLLILWSPLGNLRAPRPCFKYDPCSLAQAHLDDDHPLPVTMYPSHPLLAPAPLSKTARGLRVPRVVWLPAPGRPG